MSLFVFIGKMSKKVQLCVDKHNSQCAVLNLPDNVLLLILQYVDTVSLAHVSRVCRRWYCLSCDKTLTKFFDLRLCPLSLPQLWKVSHRKLCSDTIAIHLKGASRPVRVMERISFAYLVDMSRRCPLITTLSLQKFDLTEIPLNLLSQKLKRLSLRESMLSMGWFDCLKTKEFSLLNLIFLDLHSCSKLSNNDLESLSYLTNIKTLLLGNCFRISARGIPSITANMKQLKHVDFSGCPGVNNVVLYYLSTLSLEQLQLRFCHLVTDHGINNLFSSGIGKTLKVLDIYSCHEVTDESLDTIMKYAKCLHTLDVGCCNKLTALKLDELKGLLVDCEVLSHTTNNELTSKCLNQVNFSHCVVMDKVNCTGI